MSPILISIIIPTYNRRKILESTLKALEKQNFEDFEVVIVDDGSEDKTQDMMNNFLKNTVIKIKYFKKNHEGQGIARNFGLEKANGEFVLFLGDDMIPLPNLLQEHFNTHTIKKNIAVLGYVDWHPDLKITDFMQWLAPCGFGFNYCDIKNPDNVDFSHFYTSNISLEKKWLEQEKFDPIFKGYGFEDIDLGYRLFKKGLKIIYNPKAKVFHCHQISLGEYCSKSEQIAKALILFSKKHPELSKKWIKPILSVYLISALLRKAPFLKKLNKNLYFLSQVTFYKYRALKMLKKL